jgi:drug/metabolite transporter (DMT)-like permease
MYRGVKMSEKKIGGLLIVISAVCFGAIPIFAKCAYSSGANFITVLFFRFLISSIILWSIILFNRYPFKLKGKKILSLFILGGLGYFVMSATLFASLNYIPASMSTLILYIYPVIVCILDIWLKKSESFSLKKLVPLALALLGLWFMLSGSFKELNYYGILLAFVAAFSYAIYISAGDMVSKGIDSFVSSAYIIASSAVSFAVFGVLTRSFNVSFKLYGWWGILGLVLFSTIIAINTFFAGMKLVGSTNTSIISMIEPVVTVVLAAVFLNERLNIIQYFGGGLILAGALLVIYQSTNTKREGTSCEH